MSHEVAFKAGMHAKCDTNNDTQSVVSTSCTYAIGTFRRHHWVTTNDHQHIILLM